MNEERVIKIAGIDIGSNAIRLLINNVYENGEPLFNKDALYRVPVRLGEDVFKNGIISERNKNRLIDTLISFKYLLSANEVKLFRICATSALREASNKEEIISVVKEKADLDIELISGDKEAEIIYETQISTLLDTDQNYMFIDVGGGSTEITFFSKGVKKTSGSFKIGTVRLLYDKVDEKEWKKMGFWLKKNVLDFDNTMLIGSGGNITRLFKMSLKGKNESLTYNEINLHYRYLSTISFLDRIKVLGLKPDRADVILPASRIFLFVMKNADSKEVFVPKIGLADGIVKQLYFQNYNKY